MAAIKPPSVSMSPIGEQLPFELVQEILTRFTQDLLRFDSGSSSQREWCWWGRDCLFKTTTIKSGNRRWNDDDNWRDQEHLVTYLPFVIRKDVDLNTEVYEAAQPPWEGKVLSGWRFDAIDRDAITPSFDSEWAILTLHDPIFAHDNQFRTRWADADCHTPNALPLPTAVLAAWHNVISSGETDRLSIELVSSSGIGAAR
ncbi:hypothetical protein SMACR_04525 [Sordaria macrospora]|uniref:WGS project CABT00000000 data, contig 2.20 n=2 Tax=Sordaria macrospora TaxID=5147 RepID=F7W1Q1_SORMK|nr:uncharacterized protein SMAC_04525 [Sordaria macrospora k-hell]KAA8630755.1 hypothetical protein SMACR_04525 [Sordaria macrospora]WPJ62744.1 hypothetical protein SMAC4_04525 [Sordaria macrospora]CCC11536.1 unnamed protein product [Sordaria macrospora k-hell]